MLKTLILFKISVLIFLIIIIPCLVIESLNTLFNLHIELTIKTWLSTFILLVIMFPGKTNFNIKSN